MATFQYSGRKAGEAVLGRIEAETAQAVARQLAGAGITPFEIAPVAERGDTLGSLRARLRLRPRSVAAEDLIVFSRQMHTMTRAGIPILRAIRGIAQSTPSELLARTLEKVATDLEAGRGFGDALDAHPAVFSPLFVSTVRMGEEAGRLEEGFAQLAVYLEVDRETRKRLHAATRYPMMVVAAIVIALGILNVFALPAFAQIFEEFGAELPLPTRILIATSKLSALYWPHALVLGAGAAWALRAWLASQAGRLRWDRAKLRMPVMGPIVEKATLARFARTFSLSLSSGVPLIQALGVSARVVDNHWVAGRIAQVQEQVERGDSLTRASATTQLFTPLVLQMMGVGEETGALDELLMQVAEFYERDVEYELKRISDAIEPILIVGIGFLVLMLALGVYLPMWDLAKAARGH